MSCQINIIKNNDIKINLALLIIFLFFPIHGTAAQLYTVPVNQFTITDISPYEFYPGQSSTINITVMNIRDNSVYDVTAAIVPGSIPIKIKKEHSKYLPGEFLPNQKLSFQYELLIEENTTKGVYDIPLEMMWSSVKGGIVQNQKENLNFGIEISESPKDVKLDIVKITTPEIINAGNNFTLGIQLKNIGETKVSSIRTQLQMPAQFAIVGSDTEFYTSSLDPGETTDITFNIQVDKQVVSKIYNFIFKIDYRDTNNRLISKNSNFGINIEEKSSVYIQDIIVEPSILTPKTEGLLMIQLINTGTNPIENVKISVYENDELLTQKHSFIGHIGPGESEMTTFGIYVDPNVEIGKHGLEIQVNYYLPNGEKKSFSNIYFINVISASIIPSSDEFVDMVAAVINVLGFLLLSYVIFYTTASKYYRNAELVQVMREKLEGEQEDNS